MSLIVAFQLKDYLVLAADHRAIVGYDSTQEERVLDGVSKLRQVPFGAMAMTGDHLLGECFYQVAISLKESCTWEELAAAALLHYRKMFRDTPSMVTTIFLTAQSTEENIDHLHILKFTDTEIVSKSVDPLNIYAMTSARHPVPDFMEIMAGHLRRASDFATLPDFYHHHLRLVKHIWREQVKFDSKVSPTFDFYIHNCITRQGFNIFYNMEDLRVIPHQAFEFIS